MAAVQFFGVDNVVKAFEYKKIPSWAIFQGRSLIHKNESSSLDDSADSLEEFLKMLGDTSVAVYTLKVYEGAKPKINEKTPCDGSFNFRLVEEEERQQRQLVYREGNNKLAEEVKLLREEVATLLAVDTEGEDDHQTVGGVEGFIGALLQDPTKIPQLVEGVKAVLNMFSVKPPPQYAPPQQLRPVAIAGIDDDAKLKSAISRLLQHDTKIADHLTKLADIADQDKNTFDYLIGMLEKM